MSPLVVLNEVHKSFGKKLLFDDLNLTLPRGQLIAITGESGAGKSTLLHIIAGLEAADQGRVQSCGMDVQELRGRKKLRFYRESVAFVFQNFALIEYETVEANLEIALHYVAMSKKEKVQAKERALAQVGLPGFLKRPVYELSGGEQQRVALARAALKPAKLILCDEPTGSLDPHHRDQVMQILRSFCDQGKTVLVVSHDSGILPFCDEHLHLEGGHLWVQ